jgi:hypothetical protein
MSYRPYQEIIRRKSRRVYVGRVPVGDGAPITVQTMTNTLTTDVEGTIAQIRRAELAGVDIVRVSCPDQESALALKDIVHEVNGPIVADIHFHYKRAIEAADSGAACLRINPGNIGSQERVKEVIRAARDHGCSMRIGVNAGSLEKHLLEKYGEPNPEALVESALFHADILQQHDFHDFKISVKASDVFLAVAAYQQLAEVCDHPLHIGITEAGGRRMGTVKSSIGLGSLLWAAVRRARGRGAGGLGPVEGSRHPPSRGEGGVLPILRAAGVQRDPDGADARGSAGAYRDADHALHHRLRGERARRGTDDRPRRHRRRQRPPHDLPRRQDRPHDRRRLDDRPHRRTRGGEGGRVEDGAGSRAAGGGVIRTPRPLWERSARSAG